MPIQFNIDLTQRRRQQEALADLERQRLQSEALRQSVFGQIEPGPPTRFGELSVAGGQLQPSPFVEQLFADPSTAGVGIKQTLALLEQQRVAEQQQRDLAQQQQVLGGLVTEKPALDPLAQLAITPGFEPTARPALVGAVTPTQVGADADIVQSSQFMAGGGVRQVMRSGAVRLVTPEQDNLDKIRAAERYGAELQGLRAGERGAAMSAQKKALDAFTKLPSVRKTIAMYDEGIRLIQAGAGTGAIESRFPSFKAASVELDNVQANLGLNVIQNTTFGSLSEEELKFALRTTMPQGLDGPQLIQWMERKRAVQDKLASYLEKAAIFLGTPGNTIADFLRLQRTQQFTGDVVPTTPLPAPSGTPPPPPGFR